MNPSTARREHRPRSNVEQAASGASLGLWPLACAARLERRLLTAWLLLLVCRRPCHGYELSRQLARHGLVVDTSVIYRALRKLEAQGCLTSQWTTSSAGPRRRGYQLTAGGRDRLDELAASIATERDVCEDFLGVHATHATQAARHP